MYLLAPKFPFITPVGPVGLPLWIVLVVLGREVFMTVFRQMAARRGVVIAAIRSAKWKTGFQLIWQGSAYCWFWAATLAGDRRWDDFAQWRGFALFNGTVGTLMMIGAVFLTLYSLAVYMRSFSGVFSENTK
jgi:phosphatidylglycerophosphate synthase